MIRGGFLDTELRQGQIELAREGSAPHRVVRRADALGLPDQGMSREAVARVLLWDDATIRTRHRLYRDKGIGGVVSIGYDGTACRLWDKVLPIGNRPHSLNSLGVKSWA
jgi:hypothetical protein